MEYSYLSRPEALADIPLQLADNDDNDPSLNDPSLPILVPSNTVPPLGAVVSYPKSSSLSKFPP
jgi:hypothetical protein